MGKIKKKDIFFLTMGILLGIFGNIIVESLYKVYETCFGLIPCVAWIISLIVGLVLLGCITILLWKVKIET